MDEQFVRLTVRSIDTRTFSFPFAFNSKIELNMQLPIHAFDSIYASFSDQIPLQLTICDIQCIFDCFILSVETRQAESTDKFVRCTVTVSSISRILFDNKISEDRTVGFDAELGQ